MPWKQWKACKQKIEGQSQMSGHHQAVVSKFTYVWQHSLPLLGRHFQIFTPTDSNVELEKKKFLASAESCFQHDHYAWTPESPYVLCSSILSLFSSKLFHVTVSSFVAQVSCQCETIVK